MKTQDIDIKNFEGNLPIDHSLVVYESGGDPFEGIALYGFDEIGDFDHEFEAPQYCIMRN